MGYRGKSKVPSYWWDYDKDLNIIIESDLDELPIVATFYSIGKTSDHQIEIAERLIEDLKAGRAKL